jgi:hypothetical protein
MKDEQYQYFLAIKDFRVKESVSPLNLERENIKKIIINKRKIQFIDDLQVNLLKDAFKSNDAEIIKLGKK